MEDSLSDYLENNKSSFSTVKWAPRNAWGIFQKNKVLNDIEEMLRNNLPVVFSYDGSRIGKEKETLIMYKELNDARIRLQDKDIDEDKTEPVTSHYMTIIGTHKYLDKASNHYETILKVESWGNIYYVRYDDYSRRLSYVTNILRIS